MECARDDWEIVHNLTTLTQPMHVEDVAIEEDTDINLEQQLLDVLELENEKLADCILTSPINKAFACAKTIPISDIVKNTPTPVMFNIICQILKHNVALDWRVTLVLSGVSVYVFLSRYSYIYRYYCAARKVKNELLARK